MMSDTWPTEVIPDEDSLFMRVHRNYIKDGQPIPGTFRNHGEGDQDGMSTDWSKYSTAEQTKQRATNPLWQGGVIKMRVEKVREIPQQKVQHAPLDDNRSHTNVKGPKDTKTRYLLMRSWEWAIQFNSSETA